MLSVRDTKLIRTLQIQPERLENNVTNESYDASPPLRQFRNVQQLSAGALSEVFCSYDTVKRKFLVLKVICKQHLIDRFCLVNSRRAPFAERDILRQCDHPFITRLLFTTQDSCSLYFGLELVSNGDLRQKMCERYESNRWKIFTENECRYYAAQLIVAIAYLHSKGIIHRDIKPENILLTKFNKIKLCGFSFAKRLDYTELTHSISGTPQYMAPEVALASCNNSCYGYSCDWWTLGLILFELISPNLAFPNGISVYKKFDKILDSILRYQYSIRFHPNMSRAMKCVLVGLAQPSPTRRLGCYGGQSLLRNMCWLRRIDFQSITSNDYDTSKPDDLNDLLSSKHSNQNSCPPTLYPNYFNGF
ncbi:hypothetical protein SNEBB_005456 [Seison nebaliae]|nr:hypothetical protein SNEBB_005456 [Seison nebaliae]